MCHHLALNIDHNLSINFTIKKTKVMLMSTSESTQAESFVFF
ncbi:hypothetical protein GNIT_2899 [Glaciecola nitratireducens FR1064]|uniref:Uncharacterized protein n=1 Tax=Glaciecola nitratireducens (strain JCM 12485 / KCTC 12276 / FR1064) TaxID=1085623 RepID=G4QMR3_GLANF|nr:hypothetical protein GNIT_2899 [Glaciecola nitratireducens FR1064]